MKRHPRSCLTFLAAFALIGCGGDEDTRDLGRKQVAGKLVLSGSTTLGPLMADIARRLNQLYPGLEVEVRKGGSTRGIQDARHGTVNVGMSSRSLQAAERELHSFAVARDGVCFLVHKDNPVTGLDREQELAILTNKVKNWKEVGGRDTPIVVVARSEGRSEVELMTNHFHIKPADIKAQTKVGDNQDAVAAAANDPNAITFMSVGEASEEAKKGKPIKLLASEGVAATPENVATSTFPITRPLILVTRELPTGASKVLVDYALSSKVRDLIQSHGFVPYLD
ncbi:hypothetical protein AYO40_01310 [Planctomycetaceae bacterium SCGC AG-212-D15]|nr:hypothetical protein AYO40_01310 [Planctomycetaceae bacterium SCGC AG-212-D15]